MKSLIMALMFVVAGCSTGYQPRGFSGGYSETKLSDNVYEVVFSGNGYTDSNTVRKLLLKRCAELTINSGFTHFVFIDRGANTDTSLYANSFNGRTTIGAVNRHSEVAMIKMFSNPKEGQMAFDAELIFNDGKRSTASIPRWE